jgi:hypothetical protein
MGSRVFSVAALLLTASVSGCNTAPGQGELFMSSQEVTQKDDAACRRYGAKPGTDIYIQCRMQQDTLRSSNKNAAAARNSTTTCMPSGYGNVTCF